MEGGKTFHAAGAGGSGLKVAQLLWLEAEHREAQPVGRFVQREPGGAERMPRIPQQMDAACRCVALRQQQHLPAGTRMPGHIQIKC